MSLKNFEVSKLSLKKLEARKPQKIKKLKKNDNFPHKLQGKRSRLLTSDDFFLGAFWSRMKRKNSSSPKTPLPSKSTHPANEQDVTWRQKNKNLRECRWATKWKYHEISEPQSPLKMRSVCKSYPTFHGDSLFGYDTYICIYIIVCMHVTYVYMQHMYILYLYML